MLIALTGYARVGKDTAGAYLAEYFDYTRVSFAEPLKMAALALDPIIYAEDEDQDNPTGRQVYTRLSDLVESNGMDWAKETVPEVRRTLQRMGTEVGRNIFGNSFWVDLAFARSAQYDNVVITDCRFPNEADAVVDRGGIVVRVNRPGIGAVNDHPSDKSVDLIEADYVLDNDGDVEQLFRNIEDMMHWIRQEKE